MNKPAKVEVLTGGANHADIDKLTADQAIRLKKREVDRVKVAAKLSEELADERAINDKATQLPEPSGFKLLIMLPTAEETFSEGGLFKAKATKDLEEVSSICGFVLKMGADAYQDKRRFPGEPYCAVGDWVMFKPYSGTRFLIHGAEFRLINDDSVDAVVDDPRGIAKR